MVIYIFLFLLLFAFGLIDVYLDDVELKIYLLFSLGLIFILISGLRWETGTDWVNYINYFQNNNSFLEFSKVDDFEYGYRILNFLVKCFSDKYTFLLTALAILSILPKILSFRNFNYFLIVFFGFYALFEADMFAVRQSIALGFSILGVYYIVKRNIYPFLLTIFAGMFFHLTIIGFLPAYFIYNSKWLNKFSIYLIVFAILGWLLKAQELIFNFALSRFTDINPDSRTAEQIYEYSQRSDSVDQLSILGVLSRVIIVLYIWVLSIKRPSDKFLNGMLNIYMVGFMIYLILGSSFIVFIRLSWYYTYVEIFLISYSLTLYKTKSDRILVYLVFTLYFAARLFQTITSQADLKVPFYFIWNESHRTTF